MPLFKRPFNSIEELHDHQLDCYKALPCRELGTIAALDYCAQHGLTVPQWALGSAPVLMTSLLSGRSTKKRGRAGGIVERLRQDIIHFARYDTVREVREKQTEFYEEVVELKKLKNIPSEVLAEKKKMLAWLGGSLQRAFECAAMILQNTIAFGSPEAMKRSYLEYRRSCGDPAQWLRFYQLSPDLVRRLGIYDDTGIAPHKPGRKFVPFYDRTL